MEKTEQQKKEASAAAASAAMASIPASERIPNVVVGKELYISGIPKIRQQALKWNGWGYRDSGFIFTDEGCFKFIGERYPLGSLMLPHFTAWVIRRLGGDFSTKMSSIPEPTEFPKLIEPSPDFLNTLTSNSITYSNSGPDRLFRSHGHTLHDIFSIRNGEFGRLPDLVIWPEHHEHVELIVKLAIDYNYVLIPFGGGTSVSGALRVPEQEARLVISLDTSQMNKLLKLDRSNLTATFQAGIFGQDLESILKSYGYTSGHEPDSYEFSSLGGWVATRASGMKKNTYGNIEDLLVHVRFVTPIGVLEKYCQVPRMSAGPDIHHFVLGSEGWFGVVTEVTLKIRPLPPMKKYGSIVFPDFESGVGCMREVARQRCQPASIRLMDNEQFHFGLSLRPPSTIISSLKESMKALYLTKFKGLDLNSICVATLLFEGTTESVAQQEAKVYEIATSSQFHGLQAGESNGLRGYTLTFVIAYIRDVALDYGIVAESFETSVPWSFTYNLCENVKLKVERECETLGIKHVFITCRVTQTYDVGACVYFYLAFNYKGISDPVHVFEHLETLARKEILLNRGSISHHHGVGKLRAKFMKDTMSNPALDSITALKHKLDPKNTFANGNLIMQHQHKSKL